MLKPAVDEGVINPSAFKATDRHLKEKPGQAPRAYGGPKGLLAQCYQTFQFFKRSCKSQVICIKSHNV